MSAHTLCRACEAFPGEVQVKGALFCHVCAHHVAIHNVDHRERDKAGQRLICTAECECAPEALYPDGYLEKLRTEVSAQVPIHRLRHVMRLTRLATR